MLWVIQGSILVMRKPVRVLVLTVNALNFQTLFWEPSGSVVECLTWDQRAKGLSLTALCPWARHINPCLVLAIPRKTCPCLTERLLMGRKESNKKKKNSKYSKFSNTFLILSSQITCCYQNSQNVCQNSIQGRSWSDCFWIRSSLIWVCPVCLGLFGRQLVFLFLEHLLYCIYRGFYTSACVLSYLLNKLLKRDKCEALQDCP